MLQARFDAYGPLTQSSKPLRAEEDANGDGRREITRVYQQDGSMSMTVDADGNGKPEIRECYSARGRND